MRRLILFVSVIAIGCAVQSPEAPTTHPLTLAQAAPKASPTLQAGSQRPTEKPITIRMVGKHSRARKNSGMVWRTGEKKPTDKKKTAKKTKQVERRPAHAKNKKPHARAAKHVAAKKPVVAKKHVAVKKPVVAKTHVVAKKPVVAKKHVVAKAHVARTSRPIQVTPAVGKPVTPQLQPAMTSEAVGADTLVDLGTASAPAGDEEPASAPSGSSWLLAGGGVLGLSMLGLLSRAYLGREEEVEQTLPMGVPTSVWWLEAKPTGDDTFLLEFTAGEGDRHVACDGLLQVQVSARSNGEVLSTSEVAVGLEEFHGDMFGRPRYSHEFPCGALPVSGYDWLEVEFTLIPCDGKPLTAAVRFMHPGPRSKAA
jgi:histone H1/5